jgi:hypothetical protein
VLAWAEGTDYVSGLRLAFSTVSTTGFGTGPQTTPGTFVVFGLFFMGAACWFIILLGCFESALRRYYTSIGDVGLVRLFGDRWPSSMVPKGRG